MSWSRCQVPGEYLCGFRGTLGGSCEDFVTLGVDGLRSLCYAVLDDYKITHLLKIPRSI